MKQPHPVIEYVQKVERETLRYVDKMIEQIEIYFVRDRSGGYHGHLVCTEEHLSKFKLENPSLIFYTEDELTDNERLELAREFDLAPNDEDEQIEKNLVDPNTSSFFKNAALMRLAGLYNASNELLRLGLLNDVKKDTLLNTIYHSHQRFKSFDGANNGSKKMHWLKNEIVSVIKATWERYPTLAQVRLVDKIFKHYTKNNVPQVSERIIRAWIKANNLAPAKPIKYYSGEFNLVFSSKN
ncbi:hypothetical protein CJP72_05335 [Citrobacter sp. NCU1]|uniref:hypothetical protein n=1 Tax=Citrobacter sp. NCU1 TaxID=2026683 RepID=UPI001390AF88|nr:hypothetical protein [Citrobacter sp. NCU1]NDO80220.1 hypothetical protein [Citrobacter sp. NCU1]